jgi:hypothetical protein
MAQFKINSKVYWKWMGREIQGVVKEIYFEQVVKEIKGKKIKRNGSKNIPAYLVLSEANNEALKLETELFLTKESLSSKKKSSKPSMFG